MKFSQNFFENWRFWKTQFFWVGHSDFFFQIFFSLLHPHENQSQIMWCFLWFPANSFLCVILRYTVYFLLLIRWLLFENLTQVFFQKIIKCSATFLPESRVNHCNKMRGCIIEISKVRGRYWSANWNCQELSIGIGSSVLYGRAR